MNGRMAAVLRMAMTVVGVAVITDSMLAREVYLSAIGNDSIGNGSVASPWRTIGFALQQQEGEQELLIHLQNGIYAEDSFPIVLPSNVELRGADKDSVIIDAGSTLDAERRAMEVHDGNRIRIRSLTIRNGYVYQDSSCGGGILLDSCENVLISRVNFERTGAAFGGAIAALNSTDIMIDSCLFTKLIDEEGYPDLFGYAVCFRSVVSVYVLNSMVTNNHLAPSGVLGGAISLIKSSNVVIDHNQIGGNYLNAMACRAGGIEIDSSTMVRISYNDFGHDTISTQDIGGQSLYVLGERILITNNNWSRIYGFARPLGFPALICSDVGRQVVLNECNFLCDSMSNGMNLITIHSKEPNLIVRNNFWQCDAARLILAFHEGSDTTLIGAAPGFGNNMIGFSYFAIDQGHVESNLNASWNYFGDHDPYERVRPIQPAGIQITPFAEDSIIFTDDDLYIGPNPIEFGIVETGATSSRDLYFWNLSHGFDTNAEISIRLAKGTTFRCEEDLVNVGFADFAIAHLTYLPDRQGLLTDTLEAIWGDNHRYIPLFGGREFNSIGNNPDGTPSKPNSYSFIAYPSPFNSSLSISYSSPTNAPLQITLVDLSGRTLQSNWVPGTSSGQGFATINATSLPSGNYFVILGDHSTNAVLPVRCLK